MKSGAELVRVAREVAATAALLSPALIFRFIPAENADDGGPFRIPGLSRNVATEAAGELRGARVWGGRNDSKFFLCSAHKHIYKHRR